MKSSMRSLTRLTPVLGLDPTSYFFSADIKAKRSRHIHKWPSNKLSWHPTLPVFLTFSRIFFNQLISEFNKLSAVFKFKFEAAAKLSSLVNKTKYSLDWSAWSVAVLDNTVNNNVMKNRMGWCSPEHLVAVMKESFYRFGRFWVRF